MKLVIEIPEEYRSIFEDNRCKEKFDSLATNEFGYVLRKAFENGKPLPKDPTNGDMIKALFPDAKVNVAKYSYVIEVKLPYHTEYDTGLLCDRGWWNTPYKEEGAE